MTIHIMQQEQHGKIYETSSAHKNIRNKNGIRGDYKFKQYEPMLFEHVVCILWVVIIHNSVRKRIMAYSKLILSIWHQIHWLSISQLKLKSANHQKTPTQNMKWRKDNTDDRKRQGQHKTKQTWTRQDKSVWTAPAIHTGI